METKNYERRTPLSSAVKHGRLDVAKYLIEHGANVFVRSLYDLTDSHMLEAVGCFADKDLIKILISRGLDVKYSSNGFTCLHQVVARDAEDEEELIEIALLLIQAGGDLSSYNLASSSPLHCASNAGKSGLVEMLLDHTPKNELDAKSKFFGTPLYAAAFRGHLEVVQILLQAGADINADWLGQTPLEVAQEGDHEDVAKLLMEHQKVKGGEETVATQQSSIETPESRFTGSKFKLSLRCILHT